MVKKKKAAVYDRWLFTLGGGEQVAFAYAEALRDLGFETHILTHQEIDAQKAEAKMGVNLAGIKLEYLPMMSSEKLSEFTEKYDLFINTSYLDYFPNRSKNGVLSIFFPSQIFLSPYEYLKRVIVLPSFSNFFIYPLIFQGFKFDQYEDGKIFKWMGSASSIEFNKNISHFSIILYAKVLGISLVDSIAFFLGDQQVQPIHKQLLDRSNSIKYDFAVSESAHKKFRMQLPEGLSSNEVALVSLTIYSLRYFLYNIFKNYFPKWEMRLHGGPGVTKMSDLTSYQHLVTISDFSKLWIKKYWGLESKVLYPPVSTDHFYVSPKKKNWIVHVGRFFVTGHNKKQLDLVKVFRKLVDEKGVKDWELHFVGSVHDGDQHQAYFDQVKYYAQGYPVFFHLDAPFAELQKTLAEAKIYWHATGLDENENNRPILFEHFGITTVEAMASGCVPVVIKAGGQKEIVTAKEGYTWTNREELLDDTYELIQDEKLLEKLSKNAVIRSHYFDRKQFRLRFKQLFLQTHK